MSKRLMPTYLVDFLRAGYQENIPANFGERLVSRQAIAFTKKLYDIFVETNAPVNFGSRMLPEYLVKFLDELRSSDFIVFQDEDTAFIKDVPDITNISCKINAIGGMSYVENGAIQDSAVTSVVSKDASNSTVDTITIDASIQALTGYGWGINDQCYNYIDFENKKFIQKVGALTIDENTTYSYNSPTLRACTTATSNVKNNGNLIFYSTNSNLVQVACVATGIYFEFAEAYANANAMHEALIGTIIYYEITTPIETDISSYIDTNIIDIKENGTLTFTNTHDQAVPSSVDYYIPKEAYSNGN